MSNWLGTNADGCPPVYTPGEAELAAWKSQARAALEGNAVWDALRPVFERIPPSGGAFFREPDLSRWRH